MHLTGCFDKNKSYLPLEHKIKLKQALNFISIGDFRKIISIRNDNCSQKVNISQYQVTSELTWHAVNIVDTPINDFLTIYHALN